MISYVKLFLISHSVWFLKTWQNRPSKAMSKSILKNCIENELFIIDKRTLSTTYLEIYFKIYFNISSKVKSIFGQVNGLIWAI